MKEKNMFKKIYFVSAVFSIDAIFPLPQNKFFRVKKYFPFARKKNHNPSA
jgi:hypothetical protein